MSGRKPIIATNKQAHVPNFTVDKNVKSKYDLDEDYYGVGGNSYEPKDNLPRQIKSRSSKSPRN